MRNLKEVIKNNCKNLNGVEKAILGATGVIAIAGTVTIGICLKRRLSGGAN